ncbi:helix-turn-helix transcriptional regulator [Halobacteriales archaeon Cl-PHB]
MTRSRRVVAIVLVGLVAVGLLGATAVSGSLAGQQASIGSDPMQSGFESDSVAMGIDLAADGDARWTIAYRIQLDDENATEAFRSVQQNIEQNASEYVSRFPDRMSRTVVTAENATGREMAIDNVTVRATTESLPQGEYGVVRYRFAWVNFGVVDGEAVTAGDAIEELFLEDGTSLTITAPEGYRLEASTPPADDPENPVREVTWYGRQDFGSGEPSVVFVPDDGGGGGGGGNGDGAGAGGSGDSVTSVVLVAVVALLLASGAWLFARRSGLATPLGGDDDDGAGGASDGGAGGSATGDVPDEPPEELLSNEERVLRLLKDNSGRMKQQQVAEQLDWTAAKTSQVVGDLREADKVEAFRLGRENVLTLPDVSVEPEGGDETEPGT